MKGVTSAERYTKHLLGSLERLSSLGGLTQVEAFRLFVECLLLEMLGLTEAAESAASKSIRRRPEEGRAMLEAMAREYRQAVESLPYEDILGLTYMELGSRGGRQMLGQFFSPSGVTRTLARMSFVEEPISELPYLKGLEPACGSGAMVLATEEVRAELGGCKPMVWVCIDLDGLCARMAAVQLAANRIPAVVLQADSMTFPGALGQEKAELIWPILPDWPSISAAQAEALVAFLGMQAAGLDAVSNPQQVS